MCTRGAACARGSLFSIVHGGLTMLVFVTSARNFLGRGAGGGDSSAALQNRRAEEELEDLLWLSSCSRVSKVFLMFPNRLLQLA